MKESIGSRSSRHYLIKDFSVENYFLSIRYNILVYTAYKSTSNNKLIYIPINWYTNKSSGSRSSRHYSKQYILFRMFWGSSEVPLGQEQANRRYHHCRTPFQLYYFYPWRIFLWHRPCQLLFKHPNGMLQIHAPLVGHPSPGNY